MCLGFKGVWLSPAQTPPNVGKMMAPYVQRAIILHTVWGPGNSSTRDLSTFSQAARGALCVDRTGASEAPGNSGRGPRIRGERLLEERGTMRGTMRGTLNPKP